MNYHVARQIERQGMSRISDRSRGVSRYVMGFAVQRSVELTIPDRHRMPVKENDGRLQNTAGTTLFTLGHSALDAGHVLA